MSRYLGIDCGIVGGAAVIETSATFDSPRLLDAIEIPIIGDKSRRRLNPIYLVNWIRRWKPDKAFIEVAGLRPGQGAAGSGAVYMRVAGALECAVVLLGIPVVPVQPQSWKRALALPGGSSKGLDGQPIGPAASKEAARQRALQMWPDRMDILGLKRQHGLAEAALVAFYGAEYANNEK